MLDFNARTDRQLLDILASIEADPSQFVPEARDEALRVLASRHGTLPVTAIGGRVAAAEAREAARLKWIDSTGTALAHGAPFPPPDPPDTAAVVAALRDAIRVVGLTLTGEVLLVLAVPALVFLGVLETVAPESTILVPFHEMLRYPYLKLIGALPIAMAALLSIVFGLLPPATALLVLGVFFGAVLLAALWHLAYCVRHLRLLRHHLHHCSGT